MYDTDALLLPFLQLIILSVSQCLKYSTGISEMWIGEKCKLFINFFFIEGWISVSQCLYEELGWLLYLRGKQGDFLSWITWHRKVCFGWNINEADSKDLLGSGAFSAFTVEVPFWKDHLWVTVLAAVENLYLQCSSSNSLMYSCPHSKHLQLLCSLCSSVGSRHWGKSCWFYVGRKMSSPNEEFRIRLA